MKTLTVLTDRFAMDYVTFGEGTRPLVILPGLSLHTVTASADAIADAYAAFAKEYRVYLFDRKKEITGPYSIREMAEDTALAMQKIGISDADVFGVSQGGMIAQTIAVRYPELVHKLVLACTAAKPNDVSQASMSYWISLAADGDVRGLNRDVFARLYSDAFLAQNADTLAALEPLGTKEELERFRYLAASVPVFDLYDELALLRCPTLVIGAEQDTVLSAPASREIAERLGCELYMYQGYRHAVYDEAPDFKSRLLDFYRRF